MSMAFPSDSNQLPVDLGFAGTRGLWRGVFDAALEAMLVADNDGYYREVNPAACVLLDRPRHQLIGRCIADFLPPDTDFEAVWQAFLAAGQMRGEQVLRLDSGVVKQVEFAATAHVYPNYHLSILRDVTDRKQIEAERDALAEQLERRVLTKAEKLRQIENALRSQQQRTDSILNSLECVVWSLHPESLELLYVNASAERLYGHSTEAFAANPSLWLHGIYPDDWPRLKSQLERLWLGERFDQEYRICRANGDLCWVRSLASLVRDAAGQAIRIDGTTADISDRKQMELALQDHQATQQAILGAIPDLLMRVNDQGQILDLISGGEITLYGPIAPDRRQSIYTGFPKALADRRLHYVRQALQTGQRQRYDHVLDIDRELRHEESRIVPINDHEVLIIVRDITERKRAEASQAELNQKLKQLNAELNRMATVDGLTQIANRRRFDQTLDHEWQRACRQQQFLGLILCDIDYFKPYNDNYGHLAGDDCLRQVAQVLQSVVRRPGDLVARYGGEEFVLLLPNTTPEGAMQVVERIQQDMARHCFPHAYSPLGPVLTLSFGIACHCPTPQEHSARELIHRADLALYAAKNQGRNRYVISPDKS